MPTKDRDDRHTDSLLSRFVRGELDAVEWQEFHAHNGGCDRCGRAAAEALCEASLEGGNLRVPPAAARLTDETLRRFAAGELSQPLMELVLDRITESDEEHRRAVDIAQQLGQTSATSADLPPAKSFESIPPTVIAAASEEADDPFTVRRPLNSGRVSAAAAATLRTQPAAATKFVFALKELFPSSVILAHLGWVREEIEVVRGAVNEAEGTTTYTVGVGRRGEFVSGDPLLVRLCVGTDVVAETLFTPTKSASKPLRGRIPIDPAGVVVTFSVQRGRQ